ncbi:uncharacterized protein LOC111390142, partial [Olea europaea var. sylvestris]|uniref:uncharacterized protein LOC111390142 n=1 Tax=Olea europaea var. sylvestris TaxID=158386 RepID=UPI000C1D8388
MSNIVSRFMNFKWSYCCYISRSSASTWFIERDNNCEECLSEAIIYEMSISLRRLFATLLSLCNSNDPKLLWNTFKSYMIDDYIHENISLHDAELRALNDISCILESLNKNINDYEIVSFNVDMNENDKLRRMVEDETTNLDIEESYVCAASLNSKQQIAYDMIMEKITSGSSGAFFIDGSGGTGKIFLYKALLSVVRSQNAIPLATASSGVAASLLPRSRTAHSRFKIPLKTIGEISCSISKQPALGILLKMCKLIIWDEAPMVNQCAVETVDKMLKDINNCNLPFGGKVMLIQFIKLQQLFFTNSLEIHIQLFHSPICSVLQLQRTSSNFLDQSFWEEFTVTSSIIFNCLFETSTCPLANRNPTVGFLQQSLKLQNAQHMQMSDNALEFS